MHTSAGAACGCDDDAPELGMCGSLRTLKVKEIAWHVNLMFLGFLGLAAEPIEFGDCKFRPPPLVRGIAKQ
jgi:hypothetical protein